MKRELLNKTRKERGLSSREVADRLGIDRRYYLQIESGDRTGRTAIWDALEDLLGVNQRRLRDN